MLPDDGKPARRFVYWPEFLMFLAMTAGPAFIASRFSDLGFWIWWGLIIASLFVNSWIAEIEDSKPDESNGPDETPNPASFDQTRSNKTGADTARKPD